MKPLKIPAFFIALAVAPLAPSAHATEFVYEGRLHDLGQTADGRYDFRLTAYGQEQARVALTAPVVLSDIDVSEGRFRAHVDLPVEVETLWLDVEVRAVGDAVFSAIPGRSQAKTTALIGQCWSTTGDSASDPTINFIGTVDAQPFVVRTQNVASLRIEPSTLQFSGSPITTNTIAGSVANAVTAGVRGATISGGGVPAGDSDPDFIGEARNRVTDAYGTVGGGFGNRAGDVVGTVIDRPWGTVGGGVSNSAEGIASTVAGGFSNSATGGVSTIAGGENNVASGQHGAVAGGASNTASNTGGFVGGGFGNNASGQRSAVLGGIENTASGNLSAVGGGTRNCAGGFSSWAAGTRSKIRPGTTSGVADAGCAGQPQIGTAGDQGTFAWADSQNVDFVSSGDDQFLVRAAGGIYLGTNSSVSIPSGRFINTSTGGFLSSGGVWTNSSSRALKTAFAAIDASDVLARVLRLELSTWVYRASDEGRHLGPVAEEFHALFGLGADATAISTVDASGVALAAIQGLNRKLEVENAALRATLSERDREVDRRDAEQRQRLDVLEARLIELAARER